MRGVRPLIECTHAREDGGGPALLPLDTALPLADVAVALAEPGAAAEEAADLPEEEAGDAADPPEVAADSPEVAAGPSGADAEEATDLLEAEAEETAAERLELGAKEVEELSDAVGEGRPPAKLSVTPYSCKSRHRRCQRIGIVVRDVYSPPGRTRPRRPLGRPGCCSQHNSPRYKTRRCR